MQESDNRRMDEEVIALPDDIMPNFDQMMQTQSNEVSKLNQGGPRSRRSGGLFYL
jgi:hypothetical protein